MKKLFYPFGYVLLFFVLISFLFVNIARAQTTTLTSDKLTGDSKKPALLQTSTNNQSTDTRFERCGQVEYEKFRRANDPMFDVKRHELERAVEMRVKEMEKNKSANNTATSVLYTIPVVVHIVYNTSTQNVSDADVNAALANLNKDWRRLNTDAYKTPSVWQSRAADMEVNFCLASKDPNGNSTTGIVRKQTTRTSFSTNDYVKSDAYGGDDAWDYTKYFNIWICNLSGGVVGYASFPPIDAYYGVVVHYCSINRTCPPYTLTRTLVHEVGHSFGLYHIWGDDGGSCSGSDEVSDTPNQANMTYGCPSFPDKDGCGNSSAPNAGDPVNGVMFMNYMDYSDDACYNMFTNGQKARAQAVAYNYLLSIANNTSACSPAVALDAGATVVGPTSTICSGSFSPVVTLRNYGSSTLTSCVINYRIDNNANQTYNWNGSLASGQQTNVTLPSMTTTAGAHTFTAFTTNPNGSTDGNTSNDQSQSTFFYGASGALLPLTQGFESSSNLPSGWSIVNPNSDVTWQIATNIGRSSTHSIALNNCDGNGSSDMTGTTDRFIISPYNFSNVSNGTLSFDLAYAPATYQSKIYADTLAVYYSTNCGTSWTRVYLKGGTTLATAPLYNVATNTGCWVPSASQWRTDVIDLTSLYGQSSVMIAFENRSGWGQWLFIDNINITGSFVGVNGLTSSAQSEIMIYPNPATHQFSISGFNTSVHPGNDYINVEMFNVVGEQVYSRQFQTLKLSSETITVDASNVARGLYFVRITDGINSWMRKLDLQ